MDGRPVCVVKARGDAEAIEFGEAQVVLWLYGAGTQGGQRFDPLSVAEHARMSARPPTNEERQHYERKVRELPLGVVAVALP